MSTIANILLAEKESRNNLDPIWLFSIFSLHRNLDNYPFPAKLLPQETKQVEQLLQKLVNFPEVFPLSGISGLEKELIVEHFFFEASIQNVSSSASIGFDRDKDLACVINGQDHLLFHSFVSSKDLNQALDQLLEQQQKVAAQLPFAYNPSFGYLTADPEKAGSGFTLQAYLHLPLLVATGQLDDVLLIQFDEKINTKSLDGKPGYVGDILQISNQCSLGVSPQAAVQQIQSHAIKLVSLEKKLREEMKAKDDLGIRDQIHRAFGLLRHASQLPTHESLNLLSKIKLGVNMQLIEDLPENLIHKLMGYCRKAHFTFSQKLSSQDPSQLGIDRARWIREQLEKCTIKDHF